MTWRLALLLATLIFARSMARRFLLNQKAADFNVLINGDPLPPGDELLISNFFFHWTIHRSKSRRHCWISTGIGGSNSFRMVTRFAGKLPFTRSQLTKKTRV